MAFTLSLIFWVKEPQKHTHTGQNAPHSHSSPFTIHHSPHTQFMAAIKNNVKPTTTISTSITTTKPNQTFPSSLSNHVTTSALHFPPLLNAWYNIYSLTSVFVLRFLLFIKPHFFSLSLSPSNPKLEAFRRLRSGVELFSPFLACLQHFGR